MNFLVVIAATVMLYWHYPIDNQGNITHKATTIENASGIARDSSLTTTPFTDLGRCHLWRVSLMPISGWGDDVYAYQPQLLIAEKDAKGKEGRLDSLMVNRLAWYSYYFITCDDTLGNTSLRSNWVLVRP